MTHSLLNMQRTPRDLRELRPRIPAYRSILRGVRSVAFCRLSRASTCVCNAPNYVDLTFIAHEADGLANHSRRSERWDEDAKGDVRSSVSKGVRHEAPVCGSDALCR
jgi:hypothetical protein